MPKSAGWLLTGCTFLSAKWPEAAAPGEVVIRASTGRYGDDRPSSMSDEELTAAVLGELRRLLEMGASAPLETWSSAGPGPSPSTCRAT